MANPYLPTVLPAAFAKIRNMLDKPEFARQDFPVTKLMTTGVNSVVPAAEIQALKKSPTRTISVTNLKKRASDAVTARSHNHTAAQPGGSAVEALSWTTVGELLNISLKRGDNNQYNITEQLAADMLSAMIHMFDTIESENITYLGTAKTQVNPASTIPANSELGEWDGTAYSWDIANSEKEWFFQYLTQVARHALINGKVDFLCDSYLASIARQIGWQGDGNYMNTAKTLDALDIVSSINLSASAPRKGMGYLIRKGTVGQLFWTPQGNRNPGMMTNKIGHEYGTIPDFFGLGVNLAVHTYEVAGDSSGNGGSVQDITREFEITVDKANVKDYSSTANKSDIILTGLVT